MVRFSAKDAGVVKLDRRRRYSGPMLREMMVQLPEALFSNTKTSAEEELKVILLGLIEVVNRSRLFNTDHWVLSVFRNNRGYPQKVGRFPLRHRQLLSVIDALVERAFIIQDKGYRAMNFKRGLTTKLAVTDKFRLFLEQSQITRPPLAMDVQIHKPMIKEENAETGPDIRLTETHKSKGKKDNKQVAFESTSKTRAMRDRIRLVNAKLGDIEVCIDLFALWDNFSKDWNPSYLGKKSQASLQSTSDALGGTEALILGKAVFADALGKIDIGLRIVEAESSFKLVPAPPPKPILGTAGGEGGPSKYRISN